MNLSHRIDPGRHRRDRAPANLTAGHCARPPPPAPPASLAPPAMPAAPCPAGLLSATIAHTCQPRNQGGSDAL